MNPWEHLINKRVRNRKEDEACYAAALSEFQSGEIRLGLMAKAMAESDGYEQKAKSIYIKHLAIAIRDDLYLENRTREETAHAAMGVTAREQLEAAEKARASAVEPEQQPVINDFWAHIIGTFILLALGWLALQSY
jgi:hypothetical protein